MYIHVCICRYGYLQYGCMCFQPGGGGADRLKLPCSYKVNELSRFALVMYMSEFRLRGMTAITSDGILNLPMTPRTIRNK